LELLCAWEEQREYERIRPLVLFGEPIPERAVQTGTSERTLYRRIAGFEEDGMRSLFGSDPAKRRVLPASLRRLIVDLKAEHPTLNLNEIERICYVRTGRKPHLATVRGVLDEEPVPIKAFRRFEPYHEIPEGRERRKAVVALHYEGRTRAWPATSRSTAPPCAGCSSDGSSKVRRDSRTENAAARRACRRWISRGHRWGGNVCRLPP
jgi:putative transposase